MYLTRFRTYKIALPPQTKPLEESEASDTYRQAPCTVLVNFEEKPTFMVLWFAVFI